MQLTSWQRAVLALYRGENWYPDDVDISGALHDFLSRPHSEAR